MNNQINLQLGKTKSSPSLAKKRAFFHTISISLLFGFAFFSIVLFILISLSPLPSLQEREKVETKRLSFFKDTIVKINLTKERIDNVDKILRDRPTYSQSLLTIKSLLPTEAAINEIHLNDKNLTFTITSKSLLPLDTFLNSLKMESEKGEKFKKITIVTLEKNLDKEVYILVLKLV